MPYHFEFDSARRILRCVVQGRVTDAELRDYYRDAGKFVAQTDPLAVITDTTPTTSFDVSPATIRDLAKLPPAFPQAERPRIVIAPAAEIFGLVRMFEMLGQETRPNLHSVRTESEALAILGVQDLKFEPIELK